MDDAKPVEGFEDYVVTKSGLIYNAHSGLQRKTSLTQMGAVKVTLFRDGKACTRSLPLIVAKAWLWNDFDPEIFDTPIHRDNDQTHNHVDNLMWRPRWFAVKYQRQYWNEEFRFSTTKLEDCDTGETYKGFLEPCQRYGLLYMDVMKSCTQDVDVFPTWKSFRFAS